MAKRYSREQVLSRLHETINKKEPILAVGAGSGLVAKCADLAGSDLLIVYCTGRARHMGIGTAIIGDPNTITLGMSHEISHVVKETPLIAGIQATDPTRDMKDLLAQFASFNYSGVINYPSVTHYGEHYAEVREASGRGYSKEKEVLLLARSMGFVTVTYAYRAKDAEIFAEAVDIIIPHIGWTAGGLSGSKYAEKIPLEVAAKGVEEMAQIARKVNPQIIVLCHGGPISGPKETAFIYKHSSAQGFVGGSSTERIPIEKAIMGIVHEFKSVTINKK